MPGDSDTPVARLFRERLLPLVLAAACGLLMLRTALPIHFVGPSDEANYLAAARVAPRHVLYDQQPYVIHPPAYPIAIRLAAAAGDLARGAIVLGVAANAGLVVIVFALARRLGAGPAGASLGALTFGCSWFTSYTSHGAFREPFQTLLLEGLVLTLAVPGRVSRPRRVLGCALAATAALTWDPFVLAAPLLLGGGLLAPSAPGRPGRRAAALATSLVLVLTWLAWATWRRATLERTEAYPAGIDGTVETTRPLTPAAFFNPNFFPETARHNAYFWPRHPTPGHVLDLVTPAAFAKESIYADVEPTSASTGAGALLLGLAALGLVATISRGESRTLALVLPPSLFLAAPGLLGNTARYAAAIVPITSVLAGLGADALVRRAAGTVSRARPEAVALGIVLAGALALGLVTVAARPESVLTRPDVFEGRAAAAVIRAQAPGARVAAHVGLPPELCWLLPEARVIALPFSLERLDPVLASYDPEVLIVPLALSPHLAEGRTERERDEAYGIPVLREIARRAATGELRPLGIAVEAEESDYPRVRAFQLLARGTRRLAPFGLAFDRSEASAAAHALAAARAGGRDREPATRAALAAHRPDLVPYASEPGVALLLAELR